MPAVRAHLTALPSPADERRAWDQRAAGLQLPTKIGETRIEWEPWEPPLQMTHIPGECDDCGVNDGARATGIVIYRRHSGAPRPLRRFFAHACLACGVIDVFDWYPDGPGVLKAPDFVEAWTNRRGDDEQLELFDLDGVTP